MQALALQLESTQAPSDLAALTDDQLENELATLAAHIHAATYRLLLYIREYDAREAWTPCRSCAHWLNWRIGMDLGAAREHVRVARALADLPRVADALRRGALSYSKARAITRVANSENEADLVRIALAGTASHMEKLVRLVRRYSTPDDAVQELKRRSLTYFHDEQGMLVLQVRLPAVEGAVVLKALEAAMDAQAHDVSAETLEGERPTHAQRAADALVHVAESALASGLTTAATAERYQVVIHKEVDGCRLDDDTHVFAETSRRLTCDASTVEMTHDNNGNVLNVGRKTRKISAALHRALKVRDRTCQFPGCANSRFVDAHHIQHWADGGETKLTNLLLLCRAHHRLLHEGGYALTRDSNGEFGVKRPNGIVIDPSPSFDDAVDLEALVRAHENLGIDGKTQPTWEGERMDYSIAYDAVAPSAA